MGKKGNKFVARFAKSAGDYAYTEQLTDTDWAWEFLRRNRSYRHDVYAARIRFHPPFTHVSGVRIYRAFGNQSRAHHWGLTCFANPDLNALQTDVFWESEILSRSIDAGSSVGERLRSHPDLDLSEHKNCIAVLCANERQKLLFRFKSVLIDMSLTGPSPLFSPIILQFRVDGFEEVTKRAKTLLLLYDLVRSQLRNDPKPISRREQSYRKRYLIALDCHQRGGSLQDTARVFQAFGLTRLKWSVSGDEALKKHVWRCRNKGLHLMRGGYRNYL